MSSSSTNSGSRGERGQVIVLFALLLPAFLALSGFVVGIGNWYTHAKHLQTKADAGAFAGGGVWGFPCGPDIDLKIEQETREYAGPHIKADGTPYAGATYNPQVGNVSGSQIHVVLNGTAWYDDDSNPAPAELNSPNSASICNAKVVDVKMTEDNSFPLASLIPLFPDIKRKARVEIQEIEGLSGLLPIAVRVPRPLSAVAVFYDESTGLVLDAKNMCEKIGVAPVGLSGWTTLDPTNQQGPGPSSICTSWADFNVANKTGVVVATSFRPNCDAAGATAPCLQDSGWVGSPITNFCRQASGVVQCWDATGSGSTQNVQGGVQYIRGYDPTGNGNGPPSVNSVFFDAAPASCGGAYFNSIQGTCSGTQLTVKINLGTLNGTYPNGSPPPATVVGPLQAQDVEVSYMLGRSDGSDQCSGYPASCQLNLASLPDATGVVTFTTTGANHPQFTADTQANAIGIQVRVRNTTNLSTGDCANFNNACRFHYIGSGATPVNQNSADQAAELVASPIQRSFSGSLDRTGSLKWTRLTADVDVTGPQTCDGVPALGLTETGEAASSRAGRNCFYFEMGLQGGLALDQDEPPIAFNLGTTGSQRALIDCDDAAGSNLSSEIQNGCTPRYATHQFSYTPYCPPVNSINGLLATHPAPWDASNGWPQAGGTRCVVTQTGAANQIMSGFNQRMFGVSNNPSCPSETGHYVRGRNYWHDANNDYSDALGTDLFTFAQNSPGPRGNRLKNIDPRLVTLFFTPYDSFASTGNEVFPIVGFGSFYVTGYGRTTGGGGSWQGGAPEDPCTEGNVGNPLDGIPHGVGNEPPPDLNLAANQTWVWGHFVNPVLLTTNANPSGALCRPGVSFQPCVAVLVE